MMIIPRNINFDKVQQRLYENPRILSHVQPREIMEAIDRGKLSAWYEELTGLVSQALLDEQGELIAETREFFSEKERKQLDDLADQNYQQFIVAFIQSVLTNMRTVVNNRLLTYFDDVSKSSNKQPAKTLQAYTQITTQQWQNAHIDKLTLRDLIRCLQRAATAQREVEQARAHAQQTAQQARATYDVAKFTEAARKAAAKNWLHGGESGRPARLEDLPPEITDAVSKRLFEQLHDYHRELFQQKELREKLGLEKMSLAPTAQVYQRVNWVPPDAAEAGFRSLERYEKTLKNRTRWQKFLDFFRPSVRHEKALVRNDTLREAIRKANVIASDVHRSGLNISKVKDTLNAQLELAHQYRDVLVKLSPATEAGKELKSAMEQRVAYAKQQFSALQTEHGQVAAENTQLAEQVGHVLPSLDEIKQQKIAEQRRILEHNKKEHSHRLEALRQQDRASHVKTVLDIEKISSDIQGLQQATETQKEVIRQVQLQLAELHKTHPEILSDIVWEAKAPTYEPPTIVPEVVSAEINTEVQLPPPLTREWYNDLPAGTGLNEENEKLIQENLKLHQEIDTLKNNLGRALLQRAETLHAYQMLAEQKYQLEKTQAENAEKMHEFSWRLERAIQLVSTVEQKAPAGIEKELTKTAKAEAKTHEGSAAQKHQADYQKEQKEKLQTAGRELQAQLTKLRNANKNRIGQLRSAFKQQKKLSGERLQLNKNIRRLEWMIEKLLENNKNAEQIKSINNIKWERSHPEIVVKKSVRVETPRIQADWDSNAFDETRLDAVNKALYEKNQKLARRVGDMQDNILLLESSDMLAQEIAQQKQKVAELTFKYNATLQAVTGQDTPQAKKRDKELQEEWKSESQKSGLQRENERLEKDAEKMLSAMDDLLKDFSTPKSTVSSANRLHPSPLHASSLFATGYGLGRPIFDKGTPPEGETEEVAAGQTPRI